MTENFLKMGDFNQFDINLNNEIASFKLKDQI